MQQSKLNYVSSANPKKESTQKNLKLHLTSESTTNSIEQTEKKQSQSKRKSGSNNNGHVKRKTSTTGKSIDQFPASSGKAQRALANGAKRESSAVHHTEPSDTTLITQNQQAQTSSRPGSLHQKTKTSGAAKEKDELQS